MIYYDYPEEKIEIFEKSDDSTYNCALNPVIFETAEAALAKAVLLSKEEDGAFLVAQWFDEFDRH